MTLFEKRSDTICLEASTTERFQHRETLSEIVSGDIHVGYITGDGNKWGR